MEFTSQKKETVILNPMNDMEKQAIPSEIRFDPLTGRSARICHFMDLQWQKPDFEQLVGETAKNCPFCPEKVLQITPHFPPDIISEGRLTSGDMVLFPNIAPYDSLGAVATFGSRHFLPMTEFTPDLIAKAFNLAMLFFHRVDQINHPESVYHLINWNYMPASGSSLIHPHLQVFATSIAPNLMRQELLAAKAYMDKNRSNYWDDLIQAESDVQDRFIGTIGRSTWLSAFAPIGVAGDVLAIVDGACCTRELTEADLFDLADGLTRLMRAYDKIGIYNFNMNFFAGAQGDDFARFHLLFSPRTFFNQALGTPDIGALRNLYNETLCMAFPEEINKMLVRDF